MTRIFEPDVSQHWYERDGSPAHDAKPWEAVKRGLFPSVTSILRVVNKPALVDWKKEQAVLSALTLPMKPGELADDFAKRVARDSEKEGEDARDAGGRLHEVMETIARDGDLPPDLWDLRAHYDALREWWRLSRWMTIEAEKSFACPVEGYGGRVDWIGYVWSASMRTRAVVDWKTRVTKPKQPIAHYRDYGAQLAAYARGIYPDDNEIVLMSAVISRNEPGRVDVYSWGNFTIGPAAALWRAFLAARDLYYSALGPGSELPWNPAAEKKRALEAHKLEMDDLFDRIESAEPHPGLVRGKE